MVPRSELAGAIALNSMGFNVARSLGPAIGGAIVAALGAATAFAINAFSYLPLIAVLARWRMPKVESTLPRERIGVAMAAGIRYIAMSPATRAVLGRSLVFGAGASAIPSLMPLMARDVIRGGPLTYGVLLGAFGVGAVAGAFASARIRRSLASESIVRGSCAAFAAASVIAGASQWLALSMAALLVAGSAWVLALSTFNVTVQLHSPRWVVARALSLYQVAAFGGMAVGSWVWGLAAEYDGVPFSLSASALTLLACALLGLRFPLAPAADLDLTPLRSWQAPDTAVPIEGRSGPVVITIDYRIAAEDIPAFLSAMAERRRIRRRDGARHWTLLRDLADPEIWIERFHLPTWTDYIRHNNRVTHEDAPVQDRVRALHKGPLAPQVRRMVERQTSALPFDRTPGPHELADPLTDASRAS
jgi:MFS family permease